MNITKLASTLGLGIGLVFAAGAVQSQDLWSFEDDDIDFILRDADLTAPVTSGPVLVGDIFYSVFEIPEFNINGANAIPAGQELTGVAAIEITSITGTGAGTVFTFGDADLDSILTANGFAGPALGAGAAVAMWFNDATNAAGLDRDLDLNRTTNPASNCTSLLDCTTEGTQGSLLQVDGFLGDPDEFWLSTQIIPSVGALDYANVLTASNTGLVAGFNFALSNIFNAGGDVGFIDIATGTFCGQGNGLVLDGCVGITGSGTITGGQGLSNGAIGHSDFDAQKYVVPEPATLALLGIGLLGIGVRFPKRKA